MKNIFVKLFCLLAFILCFMGSVFASTLNISSVTYDNSDTFLSINSFDNDNFSFIESPKLHVLQDENKAYFDLEDAILSCQAQDIVPSSDGISEVLVNQFSTNPNVVRVVIKYNEGFNPKNIQLKRVGNSFIVRFRTTQSQNYYFQHVFTQDLNSVPKIFEPLNIQSPVLADVGTLNKIDSAFKLGGTTNDKNYILAQKDLVFQSSYYLDEISVKNGIVYIYGVGGYLLSNPIYLSNPSRVVYDIPNAILNPSLRNREILISSSDTIKAGQFDKSTVRLVITTDNKEKYLPVYTADNQRLAFVNSDTLASVFKYSKSVLTSVQDEINDSNTHSLKLFFSKPIEYSISKTQNDLDILFLNVEKAHDINLKSSTIFDGAKLSNLKNGGIKLSFPLKNEDNVDVHTGIDGKTMRIRLKSKTIIPPKKPALQEEVVIPKVDHKGKIYVVIDPGHGGSDCGATRNGIYEKNITLDVSKRVEKLLTKKGYEVFMTRETDETVSLQERVEISENLQPDVFVSIHVNSSNSSAPKGIETHYYKDNSLVLAKTVHASLLNNVKASNRGLFKSKFYVINHTSAPAILVEIGFISNDGERAQLVTESRKQATAKAIVEGIDDYFKK